MRFLFTLALGGLAFGAPLLSAQPSPENHDVTKMARLDEHGGYNDIWGYAAPDGREYAVLGCKDGVAIINATNPLEPFEVGFFPGVGCLWRDMKSWGQYVYEVSDCGSGCRVIDMADPDAPVLVNTFAIATIDHAHNVQIDLDTGMLYFVGEGDGMTVYNLAADPVNPPFVTHWSGSSQAPEHDDGASNKYIHDVYVKDGKAHAANIYLGHYQILDVSNLPAVTVLGSKASGANFTHSTWTNEAGTLAVVADETTGVRHLGFYDIANPAAITMVGEYTESQNSIPHNPFILGNICHISWYEKGYIALDISDPSNPVRVGKFDTTPVDTIANWQGVWGVYPFQPSGFIYCSDIYRGLFVFKLNAGCPSDPGGAPTLCRLWPETVVAMGSPRDQLILTGNGFSSATAVQVGNAIVGPDRFDAMDDQTIVLRVPLVNTVGPVDVTVIGPGGASSSVSVEILPYVGDAILDATPAEVAVNETLEVAAASAAGDLHFIGVGFSQLPSIVPGKAFFDIGDNFTQLVMLDGLAANGAGLSGLAFPVPAIAAGLTVWWQAAVVTPGAGFPAEMTPVAETVVLP